MLPIDPNEDFLQMAEIEFTRRGTPLWAVVLVLLVLGGVAYYFLRPGRSAPVEVGADTAVVPAAAAPSGATPAVAPPLAPVPALAKWVDTATTTDAASYASAGLRLVASAMEVRAPQAGAQIVMVRAMADTLAMPDLTDKKRTDAAQAAFFATAFAMRTTPGGAKIEHAASVIQLGKPLGAQRNDLQNYFRATSEALTDPKHRTPGINPDTAKPR